LIELVDWAEFEQRVWCRATPGISREHISRSIAASIGRARNVPRVPTAVHLTRRPARLSPLACGENGLVDWTSTSSDRAERSRRRHLRSVLHHHPGVVRAQGPVAPRRLQARTMVAPSLSTV